MILSLEEAKEYLRVDYDDEDNTITAIIHAAEELTGHVTRKPLEELSQLNSETVKIAVLFATAYLFEHREEADHHTLTLTLRSLLFGIRKEAF